MDEFGLIAQMNVFLNAVAFRVAADGISVHRNLPNGVTRPPWGGLLSHPEWPGAATALFITRSAIRLSHQHRKKIRRRKVQHRALCITAPSEPPQHLTAPSA